MDTLSKHPPAKLSKNPIFLDVQLASGQLSASPSSLLQMITMRERGLGLTKPQRCAIRNMHIPNTCRQIQSHGSYNHCSALSGTGNHFLTVTAYHDDKYDVVLYDASRETYRQIKRNFEYFDDQAFGLSKAVFSNKGDEFVFSTNSDRLFVAHIEDDWSLGSQIDEPCINPVGVCADEDFVFSVAFSGCDRFIIGGMRSGHVRLYDRQQDSDHDWAAYEDSYNNVNTAGFQPASSEIIYTGCERGRIRIWDRRCGNLNFNDSSLVGEFNGHAGRSVTFIDSKLDGRYLISNSLDQTIKLWDMRWITSTNDSESRDNSSVMTFCGHRNYEPGAYSFLEAKFSPVETGQRFVYTGSSDGYIFVYDLLTGAIVSKINEGNNGVVHNVAWHPQRQEIITSTITWDADHSVNLHRFLIE